MVLRCVCCCRSCTGFLGWASCPTPPPWSLQPSPSLSHTHLSFLVLFSLIKAQVRVSSVFHALVTLRDSLCCREPCHQGQVLPGWHLCLGVRPGLDAVCPEEVCEFAIHPSAYSSFPQAFLYTLCTKFKFPRVGLLGILPCNP